MQLEGAEAMPRHGRSTVDHNESVIDERRNTTALRSQTPEVWTAERVMCRRSRAVRHRWATRNSLM